MNLKQIFGLSNSKKLGTMGVLNSGGAPAPWYLADGGALSDVAAIWQPKGATSLAASYLRVAGDLGNASLDPAVTLKGAAPTFSATSEGWAFTAAADNFLSTGIDPTLDMSYVALYKTASWVTLGAKNAPKYFGLEKSSARKVYYEKGNYVESSTIPLWGFISQATYDGYLGTTKDKTITSGVAVQAGVPIYLGAVNGNNSSVTNQAAFSLLAIAFYKVDKSASLATIQSAMLSQIIPYRYASWGDSKTGNTWQPTFAGLVPTAADLKQKSVSGGTVNDAKLVIDADLAGANLGIAPAYVCINLGANDMALSLTEATWISDYQYILDAMHVAWPSAKIYLMRPWRRTYTTAPNTIAGWIASVVASRSTFCYLGPDERVFLENGDNGATYTDDGLHPNAAGYVLTAQQWQSVLGS